MVSLDVVTTATSVTALVINALCCLFAVQIATRSIHKDDSDCKSAVDANYEDDDGVASPAATAEFSDRFQKGVIFVCSIAGLSASVAQIVIAKTSNGRATNVQSFLFMVAWVLVVVQSLILCREKSSVRCFDIGLLASLQSAVLATGVAYCCYLGDNRLDLSTGAVETVSGLLISITSLSLPRRPQVLRDGKPVDGQFTISALQRYTLGWARPLLDQARRQGTLEYADLPLLDTASTTTNLYQKFRAAQTTRLQKRALWYVLFLANRRKHIRQWCVATLQCLVTFLPQYCLLKILQRLEERSWHSTSTNSELWMWLIALIAFKAGYLALEVWVSWISHCMLLVDSRAQLSAMVFEKVMRMKDIKQIQNTNEKNAPMDEFLAFRNELIVPSCDDPTKPLLSDQRKEINAITLSISKEDDPSKKSEAEEAQTSQGFINLLAVDVNRVSIFADNHFYGLQAILNLVIGVAFLIQLIGVWSTIAGVVVALVFQPVSTLINRYYSKAEVEVMNARDDKSHVVTEALHGIRQIKFSANETRWQALIMEVRARELSAQRRSYLWATLLVSSWMTMPIIFGTVSLGIYAALNHGVDASVAFTALSIFSGLEGALFSAPTVITGFLDASISLGRLQRHLDEPDQEDARIKGDVVRFDNASVGWPSHHSSSTFDLQNVNLEFPNGELSVIHGKTGVGKSLLLSAIIGEADVTKGTVTVPSPHTTSNFHPRLEVDESTWILPHAMAFVAQIPWIENATIKANILYGLPFNAKRYAKVLYASDLVKDLEMLPDGEETEVGATGINLSGGQKWRLTFARALYSRAGILVLDDIFSAVDAHVGRHIFENGLCGALCERRTRILVTHHVELVLPKTSYLVEISENGSVSGLNHNQYADQDILERVKSVSRDLDHENDDSKTLVSAKSDEKNEGNNTPTSKFVEDETREKGAVKWQVHQNYIKASGGYFFWMFIMVLFAAAAIAVLARSYWIKIWSDEPLSKASWTSSPKTNLLRKSARDSAKTVQDDTWFYLGIYLGISFLTVLLTGVKSLMVILASLFASRKLFEDMTFSVLRAPLRWLDTVPTGRIMNRFVGDFEQVDTRLGAAWVMFATYIFTISGIIAAGLFVSPWVLMPILVLAAACILVATQYLSGARALKRLESNAKSPIYELLGSSLTGVATIRSFGKREEYLERMYTLLDLYTQSRWYQTLAVEWMEVRQGVLGILFTFSVACAILTLGDIGPALAGFALSFAMQFEVAIVHAIFYYTDFELTMNAVERVDEYTNMPIEDMSGADVPEAWPSEGYIVVDGLETGYAKHLPPVLVNISFTIQSKERVGVVGRTGSGKSSLTLAIFRFLEARKGSISIDGIDISSIKLDQLRHHLAIIPQDPVLFSGTIRSNIDPFDEHADMAIYDALRRVHLLDTVVAQQQPTDSGSSTPTPNSSKSSTKPRNIFRNLSHPISRGGLNLSQGQRQLLCLARALISKPKLLLLDEATSSVDMATDALIQRSIREEFADCTLLVIAHRLSTIVDFDRVLVLGAGRVVEFGAPKELWRAGGAFWEMVRESGEREGIERVLKG